MFLLSRELTCCNPWVGGVLHVWVWLLECGGNEYLAYHMQFLIA